MSQVVAGVIDNIYTKEVSTKYGPKPVYIAQIGGQEVNLGFKTPLAMGETVSLNVEHKYGSLQLVQGNTPAVPAGNGAAQVTAISPPPSAAGVPVTGPAPIKVEFPVEVNTRGTSIIRQNSMGHARAIVINLFEVGLFKPLNEAAYMEKVMEVAYAITDFSTGQREVKAKQAAAAYEDGGREA